MTNDSLVSIVNTTVYGRSKKYKLEDTSEVTLVQWAVETKQLLLAHPELAKAKRLLDDSITPEAKDALWSCSKRLAEVAKAYPPGPMTVPQRVTFHQEWLQKIIDACAPSSTPLVLNEMRKVKWGGSSIKPDQTWTTRDVMVYYAQLKDIEHKMGGAMQMVSEKAKLEVVERTIPSGLKMLAKSTLQRHTGDGPAPQDSWEKALQRVAHELKTAEDSIALTESIRVKSRLDTPRPGSGDGDKYKGFERTIQKKRFGRDKKSGGDRRFPGVYKKGSGKGSGKGSKNSRGGRDDKVDISHVECFNCGEKGHYSNKCPHPPKEGGRGGSSGGRGGGKPRGGGKGKRDVSKADAKA